MLEQNIFEELIRHHIEHNLLNGIQNEIIEDGIMYKQNRNGKRPVCVGTENHDDWYHGIIIFANGGDIVDLMLKNGIIRSTSRLPYMDIRNDHELHRFISRISASDGAAVIERASEKGTKLRLNNSDHSCQRAPVEDILPLDFLTEDGMDFYDEDGFSVVGTRTDLAYFITQSGGRKAETAESHPIDAYQIKHTIYTPLGFGPVVHTKRNRMELFYLKHMPGYDGPFIDEEYNIAGILKKYSAKTGMRHQLIGPPKNVYFTGEGRLSYASGTPVFSEDCRRDTRCYLEEKLSYRAETSLSKQVA